MSSDWHNVSPNEWDRLQACRRVVLALAPELYVTVTPDGATHKLQLTQDRDYVDLPIDVDTYSALADLLVRERKVPHPELVP